jgi:alginate O-acetyltransferase complex protein AlgI
VAVAVYAYAVQIYADFSGYSDLAIGAAALLGYRLTENFRRPYVSTNLQEFWRRWHVSLSTWLRDYLYVPLGGNRGTSLATYRNLMITMLLGGLWHGAAWTFVIWGALHGAGLAVVRWWQRRRGGRLETGGWRRIAASVATFHFVCFAWIFFRSQSLDDALAVLGVLGEGTFRVTNLDREIVGTTFGMIVLHMLPRRWVDGAGRTFAKMPSWLQALLVVAALVAVSRAHGGSRPFAYFQF